MKIFDPTKFDAQFKAEITDQPDVDSSGEQDWFSLTLGWAIGKGCTPAEAWKVAQHIVYNTDLA